MDDLELYDAAARARFVPEPPKRVAAPERTAFERDRARVVHASASRRLAAKTQVVGPGSDDFVRNRLTHSLEVAQVARDLARALGCQPDVCETAALAHDLGHPPFGHNGERVLAELSGACGGFEGNAQTLRLLTRLEAKTFDADGRTVGLNLTRATLDACTKYPWPRSAAEATRGVHADGSPRVVVKFGVYDDDRPVFDWLRDGVDRARPVPRGAGDGPRRRRRLLRARRRGRHRRRPHRPDRARPARATSGRRSATGTSPGSTTTPSTHVLDGLPRSRAGRRRRTTGRGAAQAALKNLTSDVIGRFCGSVQEATFAASDGPFVRYAAPTGGARADPAGDRGAQGHRGALRHAGRRPGDRDGAPARGARRAGPGSWPTGVPTPSTGRSPTTGTPRPTTPPGCGSSSTRWPR